MVMSSLLFIELHPLQSADLDIQTVKACGQDSCPVLCFLLYLSHGYLMTSVVNHLFIDRKLKSDPGPRQRWELSSSIFLVYFFPLSHQFHIFGNKTGEAVFESVPDQVHGQKQTRKKKMLSCPEQGKIAERKPKIEYEDKLLKVGCAIPPLMKFILEIMVPDLFVSV